MLLHQEERNFGLAHREMLEVARPAMNCEPLAEEEQMKHSGVTRHQVKALREEQARLERDFVPNSEKPGLKYRGPQGFGEMLTEAFKIEKLEEAEKERIARRDML